MGRYFGTDGFRGEVGVGLTATQAYEVGRYLGQLHAGERFLIGRDTRLSGAMLEGALTAGITASGGEVHLLGVTTTASVSHLVRTGDYAMGVMLSASHNPYVDNGIKLFASDGEKPNDALTAAIESYLDVVARGEGRLPYARGSAVGRVVDRACDKERYLSYLISRGCCPLGGMRVGLDCANGSASHLAAEAFRALGVTVVVTGDTPDGVNINAGVGSTHIAHLAGMVRAQGLDVGFAFDGDADRCIAVDADGRVVDGDGLLYLSAVWSEASGRLAQRTVVGTVLSGAGLEVSLARRGIHLARAAVGDRHVWAEMRARGAALGGEPSGHIIYADDAVTGDGILTAIRVLGIMTTEGQTLASLTADMVCYPREERNIAVRDPSGSAACPQVKRAVAEAQRRLAGQGRLVVRPSGTEPVLRVMCEAECDALCLDCVEMIAAACREWDKRQ